MKLSELVGKTIERVEYIDPWDEGFHLHFTDGTKLSVFEKTQAGEILVAYEEQKLIPDGDHHDQSTTQT